MGFFRKEIEVGEGRWSTKLNWGFWLLISAFVIFIIVVVVRWLI